VAYNQPTTKNQAFEELHEQEQAQRKQERNISSYKDNENNIKTSKQETKKEQF
jgi:hypothetical protein